jgi:hypothetical protein
MAVFRDFSHFVLKPHDRSLVSKGLIFFPIDLQSSKPYNKRFNVIFQSKKRSTL